MNVKDISLLKYKNLDGDKLIFQRAKTAKTTRSKPKLIAVILQEQQSAIIERWGNIKENADTYLFPILSQNMTAEEERRIIRQKTQNINLYMKRIGIELGLELKLTTYVARHSFATVLKRAGAPIGVISEMLGHSDLKTTESYLDSFSDDTLIDYAKMLI